MDMYHTSNVVEIGTRTEDCGGCQRRTNCVWTGAGGELAEVLAGITPAARLLRVGEHLYRAGDPSGHIYIVRSGTLKDYVTSNDGEEQVVGFHLAGEVAGLDGLGGRHVNSCYALDTARVCQLPLSQVMAAASRSRTVRDGVFGWFGQRVRTSEEMLLLIGKRNAEQRMASFLLRLSGHQAARGFSATTFRLAMSRTDIANYLSLAVETVSRVLTRLQGAGIIDVERSRIDILDLPGLESVLEAGLAGETAPNRREHRAQSLARRTAH
jgi:CRP/FNR family transcriptional regulator, anaerobic regulatory protein